MARGHRGCNPQTRSYPPDACTTRSSPQASHDQLNRQTLLGTLNPAGAGAADIIRSAGQPVPEVGGEDTQMEHTAAEKARHRGLSQTAANNSEAAAPLFIKTSNFGGQMAAASVSMSMQGRLPMIFPRRQQGSRPDEPLSGARVTCRELRHSCTPFSPTPGTSRQTGA